MWCGGWLKGLAGLLMEKRKGVLEDVVLGGGRENGT